MRKSIIFAFSLVLISFIGCVFSDLDSKTVPGASSSGSSSGSGSNSAASSDSGADSSPSSGSDSDSGAGAAETEPTPSPIFEKINSTKSIYGIKNYSSIGLAQKKSLNFNIKTRVSQSPFLIGLAADGSVETVYMVDENGNKTPVSGVKTFARLTDEYSFMVLTDSLVDSIDSYGTSMYTSGIGNEEDYIVNTKTGELYRMDGIYKRMAKDLLESHDFTYKEKYVSDPSYYDSFDGLFRNQIIPNGDSVYLFGYINLNNGHKVYTVDENNDITPIDSEEFADEDDDLRKIIDENAIREYESLKSKYFDLSLYENEAVLHFAKGYAWFANNQEIKEYADSKLPCKVSYESLRCSDMFHTGVKAFLERNTSMLTDDSVKDFINENRAYYNTWKYYNSIFSKYDIELSKYLFVYELVFDNNELSLKLYDKVDCFYHAEYIDGQWNRHSMNNLYYHQILFCNKTILNQLYWDADGDVNKGYVYDIPTKSFVESEYDEVKFYYGDEVYYCGKTFDDNKNRYSKRGIEFVPFSVCDNSRYYAINRYTGSYPARWRMFEDEGEDEEEQDRDLYLIEYGTNIINVPEKFVKIDANNRVSKVMEFEDEFRENGIVASSVVYSLSDDTIKMLYLAKSDDYVTLSLDTELYDVFDDIDKYNVSYKELLTEDGRCILALTMKDGSFAKFEVTSNAKIVKHQESDIDILDLQPVDAE